jgi:hypothetical protein
MIQNISVKFRIPTAWMLFVTFYLQLLSPLFATGHLFGPKQFQHYKPLKSEANHVEDTPHAQVQVNTPAHLLANMNFADRKKENDESIKKEPTDIGGPASPEASSFKAVGADNLVNLFSGDFSYSIPLLDVGGYPVNLFYNSGISMDQDASWVGLGWNINPGTVSRNMRGVPDDFDGTDMLVQSQNVKPNRTWGGEIGVDGELLGFKKPNVQLSLGLSHNNYLGPALDLGLSASASLGVIENIKYEKKAVADLGLKLNVGMKLGSRSGFTFSPSLNATLESKTKKPLELGVGLSTSYNSRTGIKNMTLSSSLSYSAAEVINKGKKNEYIHKESISASLGSSSISFAKPSYVPALRIPMENLNLSGQIELGIGLFGGRGSVTANGYYSESKVAPSALLQQKPLVGFMYSEKAIINKNAVMDFNRLGDAEVTPNTPIVSAPQYNYDVFSIQGEGTGGSIRAFRGDMGFVRDNQTLSKDKNLSLGGDIAPPGHFGGNINFISSPTKAGGWDDGNNTLIKTMAFRIPRISSDFENVYFRNPGEITVASDESLSRIGGDNLVRFKLGGSNVTPRLESALEMYNKKTGTFIGQKSLATNILTKRDKRTQVTTVLTAREAAQIGLEKDIRNYNGNFNAVGNTIMYDNVPRATGFRKPHHISEINVLEQSGMRYVYGIPVYNVVQRDYSFSVGATPANAGENLVTYDSTHEPKINSIHMRNSSRIDGYVQIQETPAYASSFLLSGLLSPDYVDVTGNGITEDDLGNAVKFNYTKSADLHKWRTPRKNIAAGAPDQASFNEGIRTEKRDNKAIISYGEREVWYLNSIESKAMIAIFRTDTRNDAKGVISPFNGRINTAENANKKLSRIDLYTKAEIKKKGIANARPLKSVIFNYGYGLCPGSPDNESGGKLTLKSVFFTYNGQNRNNKDRYVFNYGDTTLVNSPDNPTYQYNATDKWGTYKNPTLNPFGLTNGDYPYTDTTATRSNQYAAAWSLKKILLPSGGQMEINYEADDYAFVQNRRACNMFSIYGIGKTTGFVKDSSLYSPGLSMLDNYYIYIKLPRSLQSKVSLLAKNEIYTKYLEGINQLAFKLLINMPKGAEPLTVYSAFDEYGLCSNDTDSSMIYLKLKPRDGKSPLASSAIGFLTGNLPGQAFEGYEAEVNGLPDFLNLVVNMLAQIKSMFKNTDQQMRDAAKAKTIVLCKSFMRLSNPFWKKPGGGLRVKRVLMRDNWNKMTGQFNSVYGQDYDYTTTSIINGKETTISSGVASYEPGIGSEENPFREILSFSNKLPLASAEYGAIEMPMLEAFFPSPMVGYSKVSVRSIHRKGTHADTAVKSAIGKQVSEFYTAKEFPSFAAYTPMKSMEYNKNPFFSFYFKEIINRRTLSQGFLVETNDMHGKPKSQASYSESDEKTPLSAQYFTYKNTGKNGLNDKVDFVFNDQGGAIAKGNIGIDVELMTDVREFKLLSRGLSAQLQIDIFPIIFPFIVPTFHPLYTVQENLYRAVTCTKLINYHAIEDSVIVMDKGSVISTKTIAYDAETGSPIITQTANEYNDPIFNVNYPAYWAYSGAGLAYKNIGLTYNNVNFSDGKITSGVANMNIFESGDELYLTNPGSTPAGCIAPSANTFRLWAFDRNKNTTALTVTNKDLIFIDSLGRPYNKAGVTFKIIRSGKRNLLGLTVGAATCMKLPIVNNKLNVNSAANVVSASAATYKEKWQTDNDVIIKKHYYFQGCSGIALDSASCNGVVEKAINPYLKGIVGNLKPFKSFVFYNSRAETNPNSTTSIRKNGLLSGFGHYWNFNTAFNLVPDLANTKWIWNSELTRVNAKGQELETKDALNRFTAAQYGFNKNMTVAVVQNARYGKAFAESVEDGNYNEYLNPFTGKSCTNNQYISFVGLPNGAVNSSQAHTGNQSIAINSNATLVKPFSIDTAFRDSFNLVNRRDTSKSLVNEGGNVVQFPPSPGTITVSSNNSVVTAVVETSYINFSDFLYDMSVFQYVDIPISGEYDIRFSYSATTYTVAGAPGSLSIYPNCYLTDMGNFLIGAESIIENYENSFFHYGYTTRRYQLCKGLHKIWIASTVTHLNAATSGGISIEDRYDVSCKIANTSTLLPLFKDLTTLNGCITTQPFASSDSMLNPVFSLSPGKPMFFSAWIKEDCATPCFKSDYTNSNIQIWSGGNAVANSTIKRRGNIIEGWQKIEGEFTLPANASTAELRFINSNSAPMYVDDIRIHPYNANMKSYVYDPVTLRLSAELDENNYATFYEYDEEGQLVRVKKETTQGIKTINETRSAKQKSITDLVQ